jgi:hypothetical protein
MPRTKGGIVLRRRHNKIMNDAGPERQPRRLWKKASEGTTRCITPIVTAPRAAPVPLAGDCAHQRRRARAV